MPLWKVYHPVGAYTSDDKKAFAQDVTSVYGKFMPKFYVNVFFFELASEAMYIGGEPTENFIRISIEHIARRLPSEQHMRSFVERVNAVIAPWVKERGFDWEFHIDETPFDLWSVQGYFPPREGTEDEKRWKAENRPSPRTHD